MKKSPYLPNQISSRKAIIPLAVSIAALLMTGQSVHADIASWNTTLTSGTWDTAANWVSGTLPMSTDTAYFANGSGTTATVTVADDSIDGLIFSNVGSLTLSSGTLTIGSSGMSRTGSGSVTISSAVLLSASQVWGNTNSSSSLTVSGSIGAVSGATVVLTSSNAGSTTISGVIGNGSGTVSLVKQGTGTLTLTKANTYSGGTTLDSGTITISNNSALGSGTLTMNGGTLALGAYTIANNIVISGTGNTITNTGNAGNGCLTGTMTGSGNLTFGGSSTASKRIYIQVTNLMTSGTITVGASNDGLLYNLYAISSNASVDWVVNANKTYSSTIKGLMLDNGSTTYSFGSLAGSGLIDATATSTLISIGANNNSAVFSGTITGNTTSYASVEKTGTGTEIFTGTNLYTGSTSIVGGVLQIGAGSTAGSISTSSAITIGASGTLAINRSDSYTLSNSMSGAGTFVQMGTGTTTISAADTSFTGNANINAGAINLTGTLGGAININSGGTLLGSGSAASVALAGGTMNTTGLTTGSLVFGGGYLVGSATADSISATGGATTVTGTATSSAAFTATGGTTTLSGAGALNVASITINGGSLIQNSSVTLTPTITLSSGFLSGTGSIDTVVQSGGTIANVEGQTLTIGSLTISTGTLLSNLVGTTGGLAFTTLTTSNNGLGSVVISASNTTAWINGASYTLETASTLTGSLSDFSLGTIYGLTARQTGTLSLSGNSLVLTIEGANPVWTGANGTAWTSDTSVLNWEIGTSTATYFIDTTSTVVGDNVEFNSLSGTSSASVTINDGDVTPSSVTFNNASTVYTISGSNGIAGTGYVTLSASAGLVVLTTSNSYTGATTITGGTLQIGDGTQDGSIGSTSGVVDNGSLIFDRTVDATASYSISGTGSLTQSGAKLLTLTGSNTYTGVTTITGGTLQIGNGTQDGSIDSTSGIVDNGSLIFNRTVDATASYPISGTGSLTQSGAKLLTLTGSNTYTGATYITGGTLQIGNGTQDGSIDSTSGIVDNGSLIFNRTVSGTASYPISGTGSLTKLGTSILTLSGSNSYTGATTITGGTMNLAGSIGNSGGSAITVGDGAAFTESAAGSVTGTSSLTIASNAFASLSGSNDYTGATSVSGTLQLLNGASLASSTVSLADGSLLDLGADTDSSFATGGITFSGTANINAGNVSSGSGNTLTLGGAITMLSGGTLNATVNDSDVLALGDITVAGNGTYGIFNSVSGNSTISSIEGTGVNNTFTFTGSGNVDVLGAITETQSVRHMDLNFSQSGTVTLWGSNNLNGKNQSGYIPTINVNSGVLVLNNSKAFYSSAVNPYIYVGSTSGTSSATILLGGTDASGLAGGITISQGMSIRAGSSGTVTMGGKNTSGTNTFSGALYLGYSGTAKDLSLVESDGGTVAFTGGLKAESSGTTTSNVTVNDSTHAGTVILGGISTYTGVTTVNAGELDVTGTLSGGGDVNVLAGATLGGSGSVAGVVNLDSATISGDGIQVGGVITSTGNSTLAGLVNANGGVTVSSESTLSVTGTTTGNVSVSSGATLAGSGSVNGAVNVNNGGTVNGSGLAMTSATYNGLTYLKGATSGAGTVATGTLSVTGATATGALSVNAGATLAGAGTVGGVTVNSGGILSPGVSSDSSAVEMISTGAVTFLDSSTFSIRLGVSSSTDNDLLSVTSSSVILGSDGGSDGLVTLSLSLGSAFLADATNLLNVSWTILSTESLVGTFTYGDGSTLTVVNSGTAYNFTVNYIYGDGNDYDDVTLTLSSIDAVPEPSTWAMIVGGLGMLAFGRRFRRK